MILYELKNCVEALAQTFMELETHINEQFSKAKVELLERVQMNMRFNSFIEEAIANKILERETFMEDMKRISSIVEINE